MDTFKKAECCQIQCVFQLMTPSSYVLQISSKPSELYTHTLHGLTSCRCLSRSLPVVLYSEIFAGFSLPFLQFHSTSVPHPAGLELKDLTLKYAALCKLIHANNAVELCCCDCNCCPASLGTTAIQSFSYG